MQSMLEKIKQRRLQMWVHSCIYYKYDESIISDTKWNEWANELVSLQAGYPEQSRKADYFEIFKDFDGSTGFDLPINDEWVNRKALELLEIKNKSKSVIERNQLKKLQKVKQKSATRRLF